MSSDFERVKSLFLAALEKPEPERSSFLDVQCGPDEQLRRQIEAMLEAHADSGELLLQPAAAMLDPGQPTSADFTAENQTQPPPTESNGTSTTDDLSFLQPSMKPGALGRLGHYEILEVIGKGGFGIVIKAFDEKLHRVVAIKVLSPALAASASSRKLSFAKLNPPPPSRTSTWLPSTAFRTKRNLRTW